MTRSVLLSVALLTLVAACSNGPGADEDRAGSGSLASDLPQSPTATASASTSTTPPTTTAPTITTTTTPAEPEAVTDVDVLARFVEERNGLAFEQDPQVTYSEVDDQQLEQVAQGFIDPRLWDLFLGLGLVDPTDDRVESGQARLDQVRGLCCPVTLFANDDHPLLTSVVLVHELTHQLDARRSQIQVGPTYEEVLPIGAAVIEGNAQRVALSYQRELEEAGARPSRFVVDWSHPRIPAAILEVFEFAYQEGAVFSAGLEERGGLDLVEGSFDRPPASSEQLLDLDAYLTDEQPVAVPDPVLPDGARPVDRGTIGSFVLRLITDRSMSQSEGLDLVTDWAGDRFILYDGPDGRCLTATVMMDTGDAAGRMAEAMTAAGLGAEVDPGDPSSISVANCISSAPR